MNERILSIGLCLLLIVTAYAQEPDKRQNSNTTTQFRSLLEKLGSNDDGTRFEAFQSLSKIGAATVPALVESLNRGKGYFRVYAARTLREIEPNNQLVQSTLIAISKDPQEELEVRRYSSYVLALSPSGVLELAKMLDDQETFVRRSAAFALQEFFAISASLTADYRPVLTDALAQVIARMGDEDSVVRGVSVEIVEQVRGDIDFCFGFLHQEEHKPTASRKREAGQGKTKTRYQGVRSTAHNGYEARRGRSYEEKLKISFRYIGGDLCDQNWRRAGGRFQVAARHAGRLVSTRNA